LIPNGPIPQCTIGRAVKVGPRAAMPNQNSLLAGVRDR
jgi:hypothetical protein